MTHRTAFAAARGRLTALLLALAPLAASAQEPPVHLKISHWVPPAHPLQAAIEDWADSIRKESGGSITATIFPAEQLGKAFDHYDMARDGIADVAYVNPGYQPGRFPIIAAGELPFLFRDAPSGTTALDAWYRGYAAREMKDVKFCFAFIHDPGTLHARREIRLPTDLRGLKLRPSDATMGAFATLLGGTNVRASAPAARDLLERGVADAIFFPWGSLVLFGIDKVTKFDLDIPLYASTFVWVLNRDRYDAMSPAQRAVIDAHCTTEWAVRFASPWGAFERAGREKVKAEPGHVLIELSPGELAAWKQAASPLRASWAAGVRRVGGDPDAIFRALEASIASHQAGL